MTDDNIFVKKLVQFQRENIFNNKKKKLKKRNKGGRKKVYQAKM